MLYIAIGTPSIRMSSSELESIDPHDFKEHDSYSYVVLVFDSCLDSNQFCIPTLELEGSVYFQSLHFGIF